MWRWLEGVTRFRGLRHPDEWWARQPNAAGFNLSQRQWDELDRLLKWLWTRHLATLTLQEQREFAAGKHPSQDQEDPRSGKVLAEFRERMTQVACIAEIDLAIYHGGRMILDVRLRDGLAPHVYRQQIPGYFRGYEVKVVGPARQAS